MSTERMVLRRDSVSWVSTEDSLVVLDLRTSYYLSLNESGAVLWRRLADGASVSELEDALIDAFGLARAAAQADVRAFVATLRDRELLDA